MESTDERTTSSAVDQILTALVASGKALRLYPATNPQVRVTLQRLKSTIDACVGDKPLVLQVERDRFAAGGRGLPGLEADVRRLAFKLHCLNIKAVELHPGLGIDELVELLAILNQRFETLRDLGPLEQHFQARGVQRARIRYAEVVRPVRSDELPPEDAGAPPPARGPARHSARVIEQLADPPVFARELIRGCVDIVPRTGQSRLEAQLQYVDRHLQSASQAIEAEPPEDRPLLYQQLAAAIDVIVRSADVSGARMGGLPRVDLAHIDRRLLEVLPQRDLIKEVSSKVKLHQGATMVMAQALRELPIAGALVRRPGTALARAGGGNPVLQVIGERRESAGSVVTNIQVLNDVCIGQDVDGEYPGIAYAERDRNKSFRLSIDKLPGKLSTEEKKDTLAIVDSLDDWRPEVDVLETVLDMLANEQSPPFVEMITDRLREKLTGFLERGELEPALLILRGLNVERSRRRDDAETLALLNATLAAVEEPETLESLLGLAERMTVESQAFENVKSFFFLLDKKVVHTLVDLVSRPGARYSRRRVLELTRYMCRSRIDLLTEGLQSPRPEVARTCTWVLGRIGPEALPHLRRAAHHFDARVRREAVRALNSMPGEEATRTLTALLADRNEGVLTSTLRALVARRARSAAPALNRMLAADTFVGLSEEVAAALARAAGRVGNEASLRALRGLEDRGLRWRRPAPAVRQAIRTAIQELENLPPPAIPQR